MLWPTFDFAASGDTIGDIKGTLTPRAAAPAGESYVMRFADERADLAEQWATVLNTIPGVRATCDGATLRVENDGLTPEQWQKIFAFILALVQILGPILGG